MDQGVSGIRRPGWHVFVRVRKPRDTPCGSPTSWVSPLCVNGGYGRKDHQFVLVAVWCMHWHGMVRTLGDEHIQYFVSLDLSSSKRTLSYFIVSNVTSWGEQMTGLACKARHRNAVTISHPDHHGSFMPPQPSNKRSLRLRDVDASWPVRFNAGL
ncbi:hypothetical protein BJV74DRAFT_911705 [Russula compacta]|nr:hypothetical protein BJV74DRAFT_911705 [Russula compacta]